jgi:hypothetical protein
MGVRLLALGNDETGLAQRLGEITVGDLLTSMGILDVEATRKKNLETNREHHARYELAKQAFADTKGVIGVGVHTRITNAAEAHMYGQEIAAQLAANPGSAAITILGLVKVESGLVRAPDLLMKFAN